MSDKWWCAQFDRQDGPMSLDELKDKLRDVDTCEVFVWRSGFEDWKPVADVAELTPEQPTFVFTDMDAGRKSFFNLQCKYGDVQIEKGKGIIALVLDASQEFRLPEPVKIEHDGRQLAFIKVISEDGGFIVLAKTPSGSGDRLKPGDFVLWVPETLMEITSMETDKRLGWIGSIRAKINWMGVGTTGPFQLICRYD